MCKVGSSTLIPLVLDAALNRRDHLKIFGTDYSTSDGTCIRDYIHVSDLADAHMLALDYLLTRGKSNVFNLGNGNGFSVRQVIDSAAKVTGCHIPYLDSSIPLDLLLLGHLHGILHKINLLLDEYHFHENLQALAPFLGGMIYIYLLQIRESFLARTNGFDLYVKCSGKGLVKI